LITSLLLAEWRATNAIDLLHFWRRRARRLLPALFLVLGVVAVFAATWAPADTMHRLRWDAFATIGYVANWRFITSGGSYFTQFASPSPLQHVWSLAIEEKFYLVWPPVFLLLLRCTRGSRAVLLGITPGSRQPPRSSWRCCSHRAAIPRVYYGTDTRAQSLLIGAALALVLDQRRIGVTRIGRTMLHTAAIGAAGVLLWACSHTADDADWLYRGGLTVTAVLVGVVITSVTAATPGPLGRLLSLGPVRWIGLISYGLYLWHWPVYVVLSRGRTGLDGPALLAVRLACTVAIAPCRTTPSSSQSAGARSAAGGSARWPRPRPSEWRPRSWWSPRASRTRGSRPTWRTPRWAQHPRSRRSLRHRRRRVSCAESS
jgi:peptidoglycan/LPS O-acetylase OafA/YrhL